MIADVIEINQYVQIHLTLDTKFGLDPLNLTPKRNIIMKCKLNSRRNFKNA